VKHRAINMGRYESSKLAIRHILRLFRSSISSIKPVNT
jgi:hypothetical protein